MERLTDIKQLKKGDIFWIFDDSSQYLLTEYVYVCKHPSNPNYKIIVLNEDKPEVLYIEGIIERETYIGKYDEKFLIGKKIEYHKELLEKLEYRYNFYKGIE